jgi:hypothetical protein
VWKKRWRAESSIFACCCGPAAVGLLLCSGRFPALRFITFFKENKDVVLVHLAPWHAIFITSNPVLVYEIGGSLIVYNTVHRFIGGLFIFEKGLVHMSRTRRKSDEARSTAASFHGSTVCNKGVGTIEFLVVYLCIQETNFDLRLDTLPEFFTIRILMLGDVLHEFFGLC